MRALLYIVAAGAVAAVVPLDTFRSLVAATASILLECTPYLVVGELLARLRLRGIDLAAYLGCGCGPGGARSLPATAAAALFFGSTIALARFGAAIAVQHLLRAPRSGPCPHEHPRPSLLDEFGRLLPLAGAGSVALHGLSLLAHAPSSVLQLLVGLVVGAAAPCALGGVALAAAVHAQAPFAAAMLLMVSGVLDARTLLGRARTHRVPRHDFFAYVLLAITCALVAVRHGATLVHPIVGAALGGCAAYCVFKAWRHRRTHAAHAALAPSIALIGLLIATPPAPPHVTETTLTHAFPGEALTFSGMLVREHGRTALIRYAILCCRADAMPIVVALVHDPHIAAQRWLRVDGVLVRTRNNDLALDARVVTPLPQPNDPFIYR